MSWVAAGGAAVGVGASLLGGNKGASTTSSTEPWEPAANLAENQLIPAIDNFGNMFPGMKGQFRGSTLGGISGQQMQGEAEALRMGEQYGQQYGNVTDTLEGFLDYDPNSAQNQASRDALGNNITAQFNNSIRPGIEDRGTFSGQFGGNQQSIAMGSATQPLSRAIADSEVGLMNADRNRAMQAMGMAPGLLQGQFLPSDVRRQIGERRTGRNQDVKNDKINQVEQNRNNRLRQIQDMAGLINPLLGQGGEISGSSTRPSNPYQAGIGGALAGYGLFGGGAPEGAGDTGVTDFAGGWDGGGGGYF
jgi:hypothetical protein